MAMTAGSVVVDDDGTTSTKTGLAGEIYDEFIDNYSTDVETLTGKDGQQIPDGASGVAIRRGYAVQATRMATAIVTHITTNAKAAIETTDSGLQRDADGANPDTLGPSAKKTLAIE